MAQITICDGCGDAIADEPHKAGFVIRRDYCDACFERFSEFQADVDALHTALGEKWAKGLERLRSSAAKKLKLLPDVGE